MEEEEIGCRQSASWIEMEIASIGERNRLGDYRDLDICLARVANMQTGVLHRASRAAWM